MIILIDSSQRTITVLADNGFPWKFSEKDPYVAKCYFSDLGNLADPVHVWFKWSVYLSGCGGLANPV